MGKRKVTILCYGDSNTYGYDPRNGERYSETERWPCLLAGKLGDGYKVIEEGLNGRTTAYDRPDGFWKNGLSYLTPCLGSHKPVDILIFMLGTNDCNADLGLSEYDIADGMERLISTAETMTAELQGFVPKMLVVAPAAIRPELEGTPFAYQLDGESIRKSHDIAPLYQKLAEKHHCFFLDATDKVDVTRIDCEHLTTEGHSQLAELIREIVKDID